MAGLIIEITDRSRGASITHRFDSFPVSVGRGYQNDLIVPDPFVSPEHFRITQDEAGFVVEDLDSENGVCLNGNRVAGISVHVASGDTITVGGTSLRLLAPFHPVSPTLKLGSWSKPGERVLFRMFVWASILPTFGVLVLNEFLSTFTKVRFSSLATEGISLITLAFVWAGVWSLIGYSIKRQARFHAQLLVSNVFLVAVTFFEGLRRFMAFALNCTVIETIGDYVGTGILLTLLLFYNMGFATTVTRRRRATASLFIAVVAVLVATIHHFADKPEFKETPTFSAILKPPYAKLSRSVTIDEFLKKSADVFAKSRNARR